MRVRVAVARSKASPAAIRKETDTGFLRGVDQLLVLLCVAGNETTRNAISWGLHYLTENQDQRAVWLADIDGVTPTAVEEIVRMASPVTHFRRTVTTDGVRLGERVGLIFVDEIGGIPMSR